MTASEYRTQRESLGLTQQQLGDLLCVHKITVAKREGGGLKISREAEYAIRWLANRHRTKS